MTLSLVLNLVFGIAVVLMVVSPLAWAIRASRADERTAVRRSRLSSRGQAQARPVRAKTRIGESIRPTA